MTPARHKKGPGPKRARTGEPFPLVVHGGDRYQSLDEAMAAGLPILGKIIADLARRDWRPAPVLANPGSQAKGIDDGQEKEGVGILSGGDGRSVPIIPGGDGEL